MPFTNPIVAGTALVRSAINSPDYVAGVSGWAIKRDGTSEFSDVTARGTIQAGSVSQPVILNDDGVTVGGTPSIQTTVVIPTVLASHYAGQSLAIDTATLYYTTDPDIYFYEACAGAVNVRGIVNNGSVTEHVRNAWGMFAPMTLREIQDVEVTTPLTPASTTPTLLTGTTTLLTPSDFGPNGFSWKCTYTADMEQVGGSNTTTAVTLFIDGVDIGYKQCLFNPGNTSVTTPAHRVAGLTQTAHGTVAYSATPISFDLYGWRATGTGTNRINSLHTGYSLELYY